MVVKLNYGSFLSTSFNALEISKGLLMCNKLLKYYLDFNIRTK